MYLDGPQRNVEGRCCVGLDYFAFFEESEAVRVANNSHAGDESILNKKYAYSSSSSILRRLRSSYILALALPSLF
jgi:hypothetical protein